MAARGGVWFALPDGRQLPIGVTRDFVGREKGRPALRCADLDAFTRRAAAFGVSVQTATELAPLRRVFLADPWGNRLEVVERPTSAQSHPTDKAAELSALECSA